MKKYLKAALILSILGNLYLGINGLFDFDVLKFIFKMNDVPLQLSYIVFGVCGILCIQLVKQE